MHKRGRVVGALIVFLIGGLFSWGQDQWEFAIYESAKSLTSKEIPALKKKAASGDREAQFKLAWAYDQGYGVKKNPVEGVKWFRKAAEQGVVTAAMVLSKMFENGEGVHADPVEASKWWRLFELQRHEARSAPDALCWMYAKGDGAPQDYAEALRWCQKGAEENDAESQYLLGAMYLLGKGVRQDGTRSVLWCRKAAEQGHVMGQICLASIYGEGLAGTSVNQGEAAIWWRKAAEKGSANAQDQLARRYSNGVGVPQDDAAAIEWARKAAELNLVQAQHLIGFLYCCKTPSTVPRDYVSAYMWFTIAQTRGDTKAAEFLTMLDTELNATDVAEARRRAADWINQHRQQPPQ